MYRGMFGVVNFYNVISNFPFLLVGIYAIILLKNNKLDISDNIKYMYYTKDTRVNPQIHNARQ
jgi:hypothetical protein